MPKKLVIFVSLLFWPLELLLNNTPTDFLSNFLPALLVTFSLLHPLTLIPIGLFSPKLAPLPVIYFILAILTTKHKALTKYLVLSTIILLLNFKAFWGQTIFLPDYEARQEVIRNTQLYDHVFLARAFHNKARIRLDKFNQNLFALIDPNNYFFGFQPRQIILNNQNLQKFPFLTLIPFFIGLYYLPSHPRRRNLSLLLFSSIFTLSLLTVFDRHDIILWPLFALILIHGLNRLEKSRFGKAFFSLVIIISIFELAQIITS